jgi:hypothetical protein
MIFKLNTIYRILPIVWLGICSSCYYHDLNPPPPNTNPVILSIDKTSVINGEIITVTGKNFAMNANGESQILATNTATSSQVALSILSLTDTKIQAVMTGSKGGETGSYNLSYYSKPTASKDSVFASLINLNVVDPAPGQFYVSPSFVKTSVTNNEIASFGIKNGTSEIADYSVKMVSYDFINGLLTEFPTEVNSITPNGYGGSMDQINFTVSLGIPAAQYYVKITYSNNTTLIAGWNSIFLLE